MRLFLLFAFLASALLFVAPKPQNQSFGSYLLEFDPLLARSISAHMHTILGDFVWLKSSYVDEVGKGEQADSDLVARVAQTQITLDPHFTRPAIYSATYLASIAGRPDSSISLLNYSQRLNPDKFSTLFSEALIRANYGVPNSSDRIVEIARLTEALPDKSKYVGILKMDDLLIELVTYARTSEGRADLIANDLKDLYSATTNPNRRELIRFKLSQTGN